MLFSGLISGLGVTAATADITTIAYETLLPQLDGQIDFESYPTTPEPGVLLDVPHSLRGITLGQIFDGHQTSVITLDTGGAHTRLDQTPPNAPLALSPAQDALSISWHPGFGSNALFAIGPDGAQAASGRGEGALALHFDSPQAAFGFRVHSDYPDPLGTRPHPGNLQVQIFDRGGAALASFDLPLERGETGFGFASDTLNIMGVVITNTDPGGIAIDDIIYALDDLTG